MILLFADTSEFSYWPIVQKLAMEKIEVLVVNEDSDVRIVRFNLMDETFTIKIGNRLINSNEIEGVYFRKNSLIINEPREAYSESDSVNRVINRYLDLEYRTISEQLNFLLFKNYIHIGNPKTLYVNKLHQLQAAKDVGLQIPHSVIAASPFEVVDNRSAKFITKGIYDTFLFSSNGLSGQASIAKLTVEDLVENSFSASLIQEYVEKSFEVRSFFFKGEFFSMAIFSQNNEKTMVDFRNYDYSNFNRMVPFTLPIIIERKLNKMCSILNLDTGSFDLIYTKNKSWCFLEVNPVGQFSFVSGICNYNLESLISKYFIDSINEQKVQVKNK